ncbi:MAG TPA: PspC domain-containing protein [Acidimicrobiales bacterium]|nr:PspC domain-containing protein [Acidimicrobiales bacterium]
MTSAPEETPAHSGTTGTPGAPGAGTATSTEQPAPPPSAASDPTGPAGPAGPYGEQRLHRGGRGRMLAGVAGGLADYFDVDPTIVRIGFVALAFLGGLAVPLYVAGWLLIPDEDTDLSVAEELLARERAHGAF